MRLLLAAPIAFSLTACASYQDDMPEDPPEEFLVREPTGECDASKVQAYIGETASADIGAAIMAESGAARLRWGPPDSAMTMDYRPDRVNVFYDADSVIERITCG